jgi:hypothetical protein
MKTLKWLATGKPVPPPHLIKQRMLLARARKTGVRIMVETGTLAGDLVDAMKDHFGQIYSIEISHELAQKAQQRFRDNSNIRIIEADSAKALAELVPEIHEPALFWLDGHYSGGNTGKGDKVTPIMEELAAIYASDQKHVVLIDDARCFGNETDYPSLSKLSSFVRKLRPDASISVANDCIHIMP